MIKATREQYWCPNIVQRTGEASADPLVIGQFCNFCNSTKSKQCDKRITANAQKET